MPAADYLLDACAAACSLSAVLVTGDRHELGPVEPNEGITFFWFR